MNFSHGKTENHSKIYRKQSPQAVELRCETKPKGLSAIYRQEIMRDVSLFTGQGVSSFYKKVFDHLDFELPRKKTGRIGFPKEALLCAFLVMKCEGFS